MAEAQNAPNCAAPAKLDDGWSVSRGGARPPPFPLLLDGPRLDAWKEANLHAVVVLRHGVLVYEGYFTRIGAGGWDR